MCQRLFVILFATVAIAIPPAVESLSGQEANGSLLLEGADLESYPLDDISKQNVSRKQFDLDMWWFQEFQTPQLSTGDGGFAMISLDEIIAATLHHSKKIQVARIDSFVEQEKVTEQDAAFDWVKFAESLFTNTRQKTGSGLDAGVGVAQLLQQDYTKDIGVRRKNQIGGDFEAKQNFRFLNSNSDFTDPNDQAFTQLTLRYNQPLLRDGGRLVNFGQVVIAQTNANATKEDSRTQMIDIVVQVVQAYWEIFRQRSRFLVQKKLVAQIESLLEDLSTRKKIDAKQSLIGQAESDLATQQAILAVTQTQLIQAQLNLVRLVGDRALGSFNELIPTSHVSVLPSEMDGNGAFSLALKFRPELRAAANRIEGSEIFQQIAQRQLLPKLALVLETSANGVNGDFDILRSLGDQFSDGGPTVAVGLSYELPYGNRAARSRALQSEMLLSREITNMEDIVDQVKLEVDNSIVALTGANNQYSIRMQSATKARSVVESLLKRRKIFPDEFDQISQLYIREVLDAQQRQTTAEFAIIDLLSDYASTVIQLRQATGTLLSDCDQTRFLPATIETNECTECGNCISHFAADEQVFKTNNATQETVKARREIGMKHPLTSGSNKRVANSISYNEIPRKSFSPNGLEAIVPATRSERGRDSLVQKPRRKPRPTVPKQANRYPLNQK